MEKSLDRLQRVQNKLARVVNNFGTQCHHVVDLLRDLHWLSVRSRIIFNVASLCYTTLRLEQPSYLHETLHLKADHELCACLDRISRQRDTQNQDNRSTIFKFGFSCVKLSAIRGS